MHDSPPSISLPALEIGPLLQMTDDTGLFQHAVFSLPDPNHGYCIDDNARALLAGVYHARQSQDLNTPIPLHRYLTFVSYAYNRSTGCFRNFMSYDRRWLEELGSEDSQGRAYWVLGETVARLPETAIGEVAFKLMEESLEGIATLNHARSWAFTLLGLNAVLPHKPDWLKGKALQEHFAQALWQAYQQHASPDWPWWENIVTYDNAKLPHALLSTGIALEDEVMVEQAKHILRWLIEKQTSQQGHLSIIGNRGWMTPDGQIAQYDQQPLEAHALVHACLFAARHATNQQEQQDWEAKAHWALQWFLGENDQHIALIDPKTGGCQDGLQPDGVNKNQGAESILAYLLSLLAWRDYLGLKD